MPTPAEVQAYLDALNAKAVSDYLNAINNAKNAPATPAPTNPAPSTPAVGGGGAPSTGATGGGGGQRGLLSDGQGGFIPAPGTNYGNSYGIVAKMPDGRVMLNTPQGIQGYANEALARDAAAQQGIPYNPALPIVGNATTDQLNGFNYGVKADGTPATQQEQQDIINGYKTNADGTKKTDSTIDKGALAYLTSLLKQYGLESLAGWASDMIKSGASQYEIIQALRDRPEYKARFPGMDLRRSKGMAALSEDEYMAWERASRDYKQRAGLPAGFYDDPTDFGAEIGNFANVGQVADRIEQGYMKVALAPPEVRQAFQTYFGAQGDGALATMFLDPDKALPLLEKMATQAVIGGTGLRQGVGVGVDTAGSLADLHMSDQQIEQGFGQAGVMRGLQNQTLDEQAAKAAGLTGDTLASGVFGLNVQSTEDVKNRLGTRKAQFDTKGAAAASQHGVFGLGVAQ